MAMHFVVPTLIAIGPALYGASRIQDGAAAPDARIPPSEVPDSQPSDPIAGTTLVASTQPAPRLSEADKIIALIARIEKLEGAQFIRNGEEHKCQEAADHLRGKWSSSKSRVATARDFVVHVASASSMTGKPYWIVLSDGSRVSSRDFLLQELQRLEGSANTSEVPPAVAEFFRLASSGPTNDGNTEVTPDKTPEAARQYVSGLPDSAVVDVAAACLNRPEARFQSHGLQLLVKLDRLDDAVPALAAMVAAGRDWRELSSVWPETNGESTGLRLYVKISRRLLDGLDSFEGIQRRHVEAFLCDGGYSPRIEPFNREAVEQRLAALQAKPPSEIPP